ncbi:hypothetical protein JW707_01990 [Candidatus Woesearchaeota archaeon]|nr:hypothetical protein [Candidatus Woesearchaeota archaeon]
MGALAILFVALFFIAASIPLHLAAKMFGGDSSLLKAALTNFIAGILGGVIFFLFDGIALFVYFVVLLLVYKTMFNIGWIKAFLVWLMQGVILLALMLLFVLLGLLAV